MSRREEELREEIDGHFRMAVEERVARGEDRRDAEMAVRREFGNRGQVQETTRSMWPGARLDALRRQLSMAGRSLRLSPGFTIACVLTLGLGIGGVAAMGALVNAILVKPLPYPESSRIFAVPLGMTKLPAVPLGPVSDASYFTIRRLSRSAQSIGVALQSQVNISDEATPERLLAGRVTAGYLQVLAPVPIRGRLFTADEDVLNGPAVVVIGERLWKRRFGADPSVVGRSLQVDGKPHQVIGIMPEWVALPDPTVQLWLPLALDEANTLPASSNYDMIVRLKSGVTEESAIRDFQSALDRLPEIYPDAGFGLSSRYWMDIAGPRIVLQPLRDNVVGDIGRTLWILLGTAGFVLLVACANVATLFLVRGEARQREMAVRVALGANRGGLTARFLMEGVLLAGAATVLGIALAAAGIGVVAGNGAAGIPRLQEVAIDATTVVVVIALATVVGLGCGLLPMTRIKTSGIATILRSGGRAATGGRDRQRVRQALVVAQVAFAFALLAGSGLLARSFWSLQAVSPGFDARAALALRIGLPAPVSANVETVARFFQATEDRIKAMPGVRSVGHATKLPLRSGGYSNGTTLVEDRPDADLSKSGAANVIVSGDYFRAMGIPVVAGRMFGRLDPDRILEEVIVSLALARREWGDSTGRAAIGRRLRLAPTEPWLTVVGVVGDVRSESLDRTPEPTLYLPITGSWLHAAADAPPVQRRLVDMLIPKAMNLIVDVPNATTRTADGIRGAIAAIDPTVTVYDVMPMSRVLTTSLARTTFIGWLLAIAAGTALILGVIGVYGIVAYTVSLRSREIGLRLALGARAGEIGAMLIKQGLRLVLIGVGGGLVLTLLIGGTLRTLLYGISPNDPITLGLVALLLIGSAIGASWLPARRAGRIDPASVLGAD